MAKKPAKEKGKLRLSRYFQDLKSGDFVSVIKEISLPSNFPKRLQGRTGVVDSQRGKAFMVRIKDQEREKKFLIEAIHLKKIKTKQE
jgi:large subunit ribosomal protein L21e